MKRLLKMLAIGLVALSLMTGCVFVASPPCDVDADCVSGTFCTQGDCLPPGRIACDFDSDCPPTTYCEDDGFCEFQ